MKLVHIAPVFGACMLAFLACNKQREETKETKSSETTTTSGEKPATESDRYGQQREQTTDHGRGGMTTTTGAQVAAVSYETATSRIVAARCDREAACDNIGAKKRFVDRTVCTHELGVKLADDLKPSECPNGVDGKHLDDCLDSIAKESCGNIVDTISRAGACSTSGLCLKADEKPSR